MATDDAGISGDNGGGKSAEGFGNQLKSGNRSFGRSVLSFFNSMRELPKNIKGISDVGIDFSTMGKKNRLGISRKDVGDFDDDGSTMLSMLPKDVEMDPTETPYFQSRYGDKVRYLNVFATHPEIEFILHSLTDEVIVYDKFSAFCDLAIDEIKLNDEAKKIIKKNFRRIYSMLSFNDGKTAWALVLQWLIEGYLVFEILYDDPQNPKKIVGFEEMRADTVIPMMVPEDYEDKEGKKKTRKVKVWKQTAVKKDGTQTDRVLPDNSVILISYNKIPGNRGRVSYTERLIRSFNLMRTMENTKVAWHVMNSQYRLKMIIPVGTKTTSKAKQALSVVTSKYKEDLFIDHTSGEVHVNGQAKINFGRNIVLPSRTGQTPDVDGIAYKGPDMSSMDSVHYFERKLWRDSRLPYSRFDHEKSSGGTLSLFQANGVPYDEIAFYKFVNRLRREFEQIMKKPLYIQCIMDIPELEIDMEFKSKLGIIYDSNSQYEEAKDQETINRKLTNMGTLERLTEIDGHTPLFSKKYLYVNRYDVMNEEDWDINKKMRDEELLEQKSREMASAANLPVGAAAPATGPTSEPAVDDPATTDAAAAVAV